MKLTSTFLLFLLAAVISSSSARNGKNNRRNRNKAPAWKENSGPNSGKNYMNHDEGETTKMDCKAKGKPRPKVTWFFNEQKLAETEDIRMTKSGTLSFESLRASMNGNYTCIVQNTQGSLNWTYILEINVRKDIEIIGPRNTTARAGSRVEFQCRASNSPKDRTTIKWYRGKVGSNGVLIHQPREQEYGYLRLDQITKEDEGFYTCQVSNLYSTKSKEAYLQVIDPPTTTEEPMTTVNWNFLPTSGFGLDGDSYYTTKKTRNRNRNRDRKNRKKEKNRKKNKVEPNNDFGDFSNRNQFEVITQMPTTRKSSTFRPTKTTVDEFWTYSGVKKSETDQQTNNRDGRLGNTGEERGSVGGSTGKEKKGSISSWTIYTIVGAVGGVVLLIGLVAITLTLCCNKEEAGVYKSTNV